MTGGKAAEEEGRDSYPHSTWLLDIRKKRTFVWTAMGRPALDLRSVWMESLMDLDDPVQHQIYTTRSEGRTY